uniref:Uncharacterized protein n=1 Tax=viral metagenome TaxID=1070528 RepID=A0A6C0JJ53_9ZZZZ
MVFKYILITIIIMNIYYKIEDVNSDHTFFYKPIVNKISHYIYFYKIIYNVGDLTLNSLLINIKIKNVNVVKDNNMYKCTVIIDEDFINKLKEFEINILNKMQKTIDKQQVCSCYKYLTTVKHTFVFNKVPENLFAYLRISGIWESNHQIGITSKMHIYPSTAKF